jgi:3-hydroxyisobutyrate dehydrogenase-like beta-hydroxyacid dehydrogenase
MRPTEELPWISVSSACPAEALAQAGATIARTPADAARHGVVATMVADDAALEAVSFGADGILDALPSGAVHLSMSTVSVALAERLAAAHAERGQDFVAAPVFGRPQAAEAAKLYVAAAGDAAVIDRLKPVFDAIGQRLFVVGTAAPQANLVKLTGNFLITCVIESLAEAFALNEKAGIDPRALHELLTETLFSAPIYKTYGALILDRAFTPAGFRMALGQKDNRLLQQAAETLDVPLPFASIIRDRFLAALSNGGRELDWSAFALRAAADAGLAA